MRFLGFLLGLALAVLGIIFLIASAVGNMTPRLVVGGLLFLSGFGLILLALFKSASPPSRATSPATHKGGIELEPFDEKKRSYEPSNDEGSYQREETR